MPPSLDAPTVRTWCRLALAALGRAREDIDAINVYPVADGDTGTNLYLTMESAAQAVEALYGDPAAPAAPAPTLTEAFRAMAHGALIGARGNSGTILAQLLRGMNDSLRRSASSADPPAAADMCRALRTAADSAYEAVARPTEGTMLTVAAAAASAAEAAAQAAPPRPEADRLAAVVRAAHDGARTALTATPDQLGVLRAAGVVDAGGLGLVAVLAALVAAVTGEAPHHGDLPPRTARPTAAPDPAGGTPPGPTAPPAAPTATLTRPAPAHAPAGGEPGTVPRQHPHDPAAGGPGERAEVLAPGAAPHGCPDAGAADGGPAFEVLYLLDAPADAVTALRTRLDGLGDSLVVVGGDGLWNVHVHVDDVGAAIEAGIEAGRPHRIRVTHFGAQAGAGPAGRTGRPDGAGPATGRQGRAVVALVRGDGMAALCEQAGATVVAVRAGEPPASAEIAAAVRRTGAREVVVLPNDSDLRPAAGAAAEQARAEGVRVSLIPTRSVVQGIAALAVHEPRRSFDEDVVAMTSAAGATRYAELAVAEHESWTMAGVCQAGDVLGLIDGDVALIGSDVAGAAVEVLDRMLAAGGEMVTLVLGATAPPGLADLLEAHVRDTHLAVDTVIYEGGQATCPLLIGVE
ncbi:DAK2 domain-containing protein [Actinacidiphila epipremni]|uniref:DAK2 domain-containing protein n=1 Tax=Actinacidiphila epipremni TaxID=2053013 RepID=UPI002AFFC174|nr:DAK2 domain-containing protein [Actinacidiphila epipremni]